MARRHIMESTFRLNLLNPQHAKINEVIKGLNPKIYKSKNQFLIEACEFYIDHYGEDDIPSKEEKRYEQFVTRDEIEKIKKEIEYSAMSEARKEVISLLGGALAGVKNSQPVVIANPQEDMEEQPEEDVMNDSDVAGLAMGWMLRRLIIMRRIAGAVGTAVLQILKWMLKIVLGALKLFLGLVRLVLLLFCLIARVFLSFVRMGTF